MKRLYKLFIVFLVFSTFFACSGSKFVDLYNEVEFVYLTRDNENWKISRVKIPFRRGTSFAKNDSDAYFDRFAIDGYSLTKFFSAKNGEDLIKNEVYLTPESTFDDKIDLQFYREKPDVKDTEYGMFDLASYLFTDNLRLYAFYDSIKVNKLEFADDYSLKTLLSGDTINIGVNIYPGNAVDSKLKWSLEQTPETTGNIVVKIDDLQADQLVDDRILNSVVAMSPGKFTVKVKNEADTIEMSKEITVVARKITLNRNEERDLYNYIPKIYRDETFTWTPSPTNGITITASSDENGNFAKVKATATNTYNIVAKNSEKGLEFAIQAIVK